MSRQHSTSPEDDYFNDLSRQPSIRSNRSDSPRDSSIMLGDGMENGIPRPKRIACVICRKRKLKCDGDKPSCGTCKRLGHKCGYDEVRRKSGPKRGYVKELEARLGECPRSILHHQLVYLDFTDRGRSGLQHRWKLNSSQRMGHDLNQIALLRPRLRICLALGSS